MMKTTQPVWKYLANLGDATPLLYGGLFVYEDETGTYAPEAELLEPPSDEIDIDSPKARWTVYRFTLEPCTYTDGLLSDNPFHPLHAAWFAQPESKRAERPQDTTYLRDVAETMGMETAELLTWFLSDDARDRALAWRCIGEYHGWENLDSYPEQYTKEEIEARYTDGELSYRG